LNLADIVHRSGNENVYVLRLDLGSLKSVRDFVAEVRRREQHIHVLINNAAAAGMPNKNTADGLQQEMQVNHFGPFLLTLLLIGKERIILLLGNKLFR
jgi:NAD(P)-dependent dehydrogenase (short-subunit alcohol dehydrogenase family)